MPSAQAGAPPSGRAFDFDKATFPSVYNRVPFAFRHRLAHHPMLAIPALMELAKRLPAANLHQHRADVKIDDDFYNAQSLHPTNMTLEETMTSLETRGSYVMFRNPQVDAEYGRFLNPLWEEIGELVDPIDPGRCEHMAFIFLSSPRAITPFHLDRVANFHLQIEGEKVIQLWDPFDRTVVTEADLSHVVAEPAAFHAPYRPDVDAKAKPFQQKPGLGVFHPWGAPHAVEVGSAVSVSLSISFRSQEMNRRARIHEINHVLRRRGLQPSPVGRSPWRDSLKLLAYRGYQSVRGRRRVEPADHDH